MAHPKVYAVKELLWTYHPLHLTWHTYSYHNQLHLLEEADVLVQTNIVGSKKKKHQPMYNYIIQTGKPWIVAESAVFRYNMVHPPAPNAYHRYSWYSYLRDEAIYCNQNSPSDRWLQIQQEQKIEIKPWRTQGEYVLLCLQKPGDSSLARLTAKYKTYDLFISEVLNQIRANTDRKIRIRMHPLRQDRQLLAIESAQLSVKDVELSPNSGNGNGFNGGDGLQRDFDNAYAVVGFNSNALTESVCEGIPTFSLCPGSMAMPMGTNDLGRLESPLTPDRTQWLYDLAYCQWREDEVASGKMWAHLQQAWPTVRDTRKQRLDWAEISANKEHINTINGKKLRKYIKSKNKPA